MFNLRFRLTAPGGFGRKVARMPAEQPTRPSGSSRDQVWASTMAGHVAAAGPNGQRDRAVSVRRAHADSSATIEPCEVIGREERVKGVVGSAIAADVLAEALIYGGSGARDAGVKRLNEFIPAAWRADL